ncbi:hypothetical protein ACXGQW_03120 [Wenyingzhuangia sp. IMCC45533]
MENKKNYLADETGVNHPLEAWIISILCGAMCTWIILYKENKDLLEISFFYYLKSILYGLSSFGILRLLFLFFKTDSSK